MSSALRNRVLGRDPFGHRGNSFLAFLDWPQGEASAPEGGSLALVIAVRRLPIELQKHLVDLMIEGWDRADGDTELEPEHDRCLAEEDRGTTPARHPIHPGV